MRFVTFKELKPRYGIPWTRAYIDRLIADGKFPPKVALGENTKGWWDGIIEAYLAEKAKAGLKERAEKGTEAA